MSDAAIREDARLIRSRSGVVSEHYPFRGRRFARNGSRLHYLDEGHGLPVVLLHGNPTWSFHYRRLVLALRGEFRAIVPDHIGCGLSDKPGDDRYDYTLATRIDDLEALLDALGLRSRIQLVLHDWGGMIGMGYAVRHPERIERIVVLNTAAFHLPAGKVLPGSLRLCRSPLGPFLVRRLNLFLRGALRYCMTQGSLSRREREAYLAPYRSWRDRIALLRFVEDIPLLAGDRAFELVSAIERDLVLLRGKPMLVVWGERDFVFDRDIRDEWRRRFPEAECVDLPHAGHWLLEDAPETVLPSIVAFLRRPPVETRP